MKEASVVLMFKANSLNNVGNMNGKFLKLICYTEV